MALQTAAQFRLSPDIGGSIAQGLQNRAGFDQLAGQRQAAQTQQQINPLVQAALGGDQAAVQQLQGMGPQGIQALQDVQGLQKGTRDAGAAVTEQRFNSVVKAAAEVQGLPVDQQLSILTRRRQELKSQKLPTNDTDEVIGLLQSGNTEVANQLINQSVSAGQQAGVLKPVQDLSFDRDIKTQELDLKRQTLDVRREETKQRALDRDIAREDNAIKREQLQQKLDESKAKSEQAKRDLTFEAESAISSVDDTVGTIDRLLGGTGLESAAGVSSIFPTVPGSRAADFEAQLETLQSQAFLSQVKKMSGMGALSENEGKKLGAAIGSLDINMSDKALRSELGRIKSELSKAKTNLNKKFNINQSGNIGRFQVEVVE